MGSNKATFDFLDLSGDNSENVIYHRNIYSERNPNEIKELGDVGNDIKIYGSKLWMVINCSNKVEVADAYTCKKVAKINIPNCRYLAFDGGFAYVSAYVAPVNMRQDAEVGAVYKVDTLTMKVVDKVTVGYQPDELAVVHGKLYVANSGGYRNPNYDRTVSVIDLTTFKEERKIDVAINLHRCRADKYGQLWVSSRGDYKEVPSRLYWLKPNAAGQMEKGGELEVPVSNMCIVGDSLYYIGVQWNETSKKNSIEYGIVNVSQHKVIAHSLSSAPEIQSIEMPYGIIVNPQKKDFYLMDAKNYVSSGELLHFKADGTFDWRVWTGDIPAEAAFVYRKPQLPSSDPSQPAEKYSKYIFETEIDDDETATKRTIAKTPDDICFNWEDADCIIRPLPHSSHLVSITPRKSGKNYWMECNDNFRQCFIHLPACRTETPAPENETNFVLNNFLMMLYAFNAARHHTLLMHASVVATETGKGYLFLGKSGTGKSTHTGLWLQQFSDCHLLNDDNPIVHVDSLGKQATVFGSPWSGKTPCYRKESMTVGAFVRLEQAPQNEIEQERAAHAFATLLPSCSCLKQNKEIYNAIVTTVTELATLAPVYHLKCLPDREATELCRKTVEG